MGEEGFYPPIQGDSIPIKPASQWTIPEKKSNRGTPGNLKQTKVTQLEIPQNCVTPWINFKA